MIPIGDSLPEGPETWQDIPLGPGQEANAYGGNGTFQFSSRGDAGTTVEPDDVRRDPDEETIILSRPPERP